MYNIINKLINKKSFINKINTRDIIIDYCNKYINNDEIDYYVSDADISINQYIVDPDDI